MIVDTGIDENELRELAAELTANEPRPGEFTAADMARVMGGNIDQWRKRLDRAVVENKITCRVVGRFKFYSRIR